MAFPRFYLRIAKGTFKESTTVHFTMNLTRNNKIQGKTNIKVDSRYFKPLLKDQRRHYVDLTVAKELDLEDEAKEKEAQLIKLGSTMLKKWEDIADGNHADPIKEIKNQVGFITGTKKRVIQRDKKVSFSDIIDEYILRNKEKMDVSSINSYYPNLKLRLRAFEDFYDTVLEYDDINVFFKEMFFDDFLDEEQNFKGHKMRPLKQNTKHTVSRRFKAVMAWAKSEHHHDNERFKNFYVPNKTYHKVYLKPEEIEDIRTLKLSGKLDKVRDYFILCCETGARINDVLNFNIDDNLGTNYIYWTQKKTGEVVTQKLTPGIEAILHKYNNQFPNEHGVAIIYDDISKNLKDIVRDAGVDDLVDIGEPKKVPKYSQVTSHTGRRTKATNMRLAGSPWEDIRKVLGHTSEDMSKKYFKATTADILALLDHNGI